MIGLDQNCFIKEYRKQVEKDALNQIQDSALSNLMNAFGQLNQTYSVLFKDICLTFGALLSIKEELKEHRQEVASQQNKSSIQEQILMEKVHQQEIHIENLQKQIKSTQFQNEQDKIFKQQLLEKDQQINQFKQRLFDMQENEQNQAREKSKYQTRIQQLEEQINSSKQDQIAIIEKKTTSYQGYKVTLLNNERKEDLPNLPKQVANNQYFNGQQQGKEVLIDNNQLTKNVSLLNKNKSEKRNILQEEQNRYNNDIDQKEDSNSKFQQLERNNLVSKQHSSSLQILPENQPQSMLSSLQSNNNSRKFTDEDIFMNQKIEAEMKRRKQEEDHKRNQQYVSSLNYNKIISDNIRTQNQQKKVNDLSKESSITSVLNRAQLDIPINTLSNVSGRMEIEENTMDDRMLLQNRANFIDKNISLECDQESEAVRQRFTSERNMQEDSSDPQYHWNIKMESRNSEQQLQGGANGDANNNSGNKKRFKKQNLKKSDSFTNNIQMNSELENTSNNVIANTNQQINMQQPQELQEVAVNQHIVGQKKNLNLNKGRAANTNFMRDVNFDEDSGENQENDLFAQFEFKKKQIASINQAAQSTNMGNNIQIKRTLNTRKKADRENLKTFNCGRCKAAYETLGEEFCGNCSRHRSEYTPPHTPNAHYQKFSQSEDDSQDN